MPKRAPFAGLLAALVLSGCGTATDGSAEVTGSVRLDPAAAVARTATETAAARTARVAYTMRTDFDGMTMDTEGEGAIDFAGRRLTMTLDLPMGGGTIEQRIVGDTAYMQLPDDAFGASLDGGDDDRGDGGDDPTWLSTPVAEVGGLMGFDSSFTDPTHLLASLREAGADVTEVGAQDVRGVRTTHYRAEVDAVDAFGMDEAPADVREEMLESLSGPAVPLDVYVGDDGLVRRLAMDLELDPPAPEGAAEAEEGLFLGGPISISLEIDFFDFGAPVDVQAPPADQVMDELEYFEGLEEDLLAEAGDDLDPEIRAEIEGLGD